MHALKRNEMRKLYSIFETGGPKMSEAISFVGIPSGIQAAKGPISSSSPIVAIRVEYSVRIWTVWIVMSATPPHSQ